MGWGGVAVMEGDVDGGKRGRMKDRGRRGGGGGGGKMSRETDRVLRMKGGKGSRGMNREHAN